MDLANGLVATLKLLFAVVIAADAFPHFLLTEGVCARHYTRPLGQESSFLQILRLTDCIVSDWTLHLKKAYAIKT
jgi:hypothetical protein